MSTRATPLWRRHLSVLALVVGGAVMVATSWTLTDEVLPGPGVVHATRTSASRGFTLRHELTSEGAR